MVHTDPKNIAIVRTDRLGDIILTLPLVQSIQARFPNSTVTLFASRYVQPLLECVAFDLGVCYVDTPDSLERGLRERRIDSVFFPRPVLKEVWTAFKLAIPYRIGSGYRLYSFLFNKRIYEHRSDAAYHEVEYNVRMLDAAYGREVSAPKELVRPVLAKLNVPELPPSLVLPAVYIVLHAGSGGSSRNWSEANFIELAKRIRLSTPATIVLTGIDSEAETAKRIEDAIEGAVNLCGKLSLTEAISVINSASVFVSNSTGTLHVAASVETPIVTFFPNTPALSAARWGPFTENAIVLTSSQNDDMTTISVDSAFEAVLKLLGESSAIA